MIGTLVVSYWRGTWVLLDIYLCNQPSDATLTNGMSFCFANDYSKPVRVQSGWISYIFGLLSLAVCLYLSSTRSIWIGTEEEEDLGSLPEQSMHSISSHLRISLNDPEIISEGGGEQATDSETKHIMNFLRRFAFVYALGFTSVNAWRGVWYLSDAYIYIDSLHQSLIFTTTMGIVCAFLIGCGSSLLAPPAVFILDGPSTMRRKILDDDGNEEIGSTLNKEGQQEENQQLQQLQQQQHQPPLLVTIFDTYYDTVSPQQRNDPGAASSVNNANRNQKEEKKMMTYIVDMTMTFIALPIFVVWFWRGSWGLFDVFLWNYTTPTVLHYSIMYGTIIAVFGLYVFGAKSDYIMSYCSFSAESSSSILSSVSSFVIQRVLSLLLAISTVSFWRVIWYTWDEFLGGSTLWSGWVSHLLGVLGLACMGCMSCILASPTVVAVDAIPHPDAADEPLCHDVPVPAKSLHFMAIAT